MRKYPRNASIVALLSISLAVSGHAVEPPARGSVTYWKTNKEGTTFVERQSDLSFGPSSGAAVITIAPNPAQKEQLMTGFGGAMTHSSAYLINHHSNRAGIIRELFRRDDPNGIGANIIRIPMGASDYSLATATAYSPAGPFSAQDDASIPVGINPASYDSEATDLMTNTVYAIDKDIIEVTKDALAHNPEIQIIAVPWSAPLRWKDNASFVGGSLNQNNEDEYADYFADFIEFYVGHGINIWAVSVQNEPGHGGNTPSMVMSSAQSARMIIELDKEFTTRGLNTKIMTFDHNMEDVQFPREVYQALKGTADGLTALERVIGTAWHIYDEDGDGDQEIGLMGGFQDELRDTIGIADKQCWVTERTGSNPVSFPHDAQWFWKTITYPSMTNEASGFLWWNFMLDHEGKPNLVNGDIYRSRGMLQLNADNSITYTGEAAILGHFSKFVEPGAFRLTTPGLANEIHQLAFENPDGSIVVIAYNESWFTTKKVEVAMNGVSVEIDMGPLELATLMFKPPLFEGWVQQTGFALTGDDLLADADPDGDGIVNLLEYALGLNPSASNTMSEKVAMTKTSTGVDFSFHVAQSPQLLTYKLEKSTDMRTWNKHDFTGALPQGSTHVESVPDTEVDQGRLFLRLKAEE